MTSSPNIFQKIERKLLTKPIWFRETRRTYPIRSQAFEFPPIAVNPMPETILAILAPASHACDVAWAARSLLHQLPSDLGLLVVIHGGLAPSLVAQFERSFPGMLFQSASEYRDPTKVPKNLGLLAEKHKIGHKPAMLMRLQERYNVLYSDMDVLAFNSMPEVSNSIANGGPPLYLQDEVGLTSDPVLQGYIRSRGHPCVEALSGGFHYIPRNSFSFDLAEDLLQPGNYDPDCWFSDQSLLAVWMADAGGVGLPLSRYVNSFDRQFYFEKDVDYSAISLRHFNSPVRHLMYSRGMPLLRKAWNRGSREVAAGVR